jgi:hypothetical protein
MLHVLRVVGVAGLVILLALGVFLVRQEYDAQEPYEFTGVVLASERLPDDNLFQHVVIRFDDGDVLIYDMSERWYYMAGQPAEGDVCRFTRTPEYLILVFRYRTEMHECAPPASDVE